MCADDGCPVAIEVFEGNTGDPKTLAAQIDKLKRRFDLKHVVLVGDRGMITQARIDEELRSAGLDWITALRAPALQALVSGGELQMSLFDTRDIARPLGRASFGRPMAAITSPLFPGERLIVCRNPDLARERGRKREALLVATERDLAAIAAAVSCKRDPLRGAAEIGLRFGAVLGKHKMAKHFDVIIEDARFVFVRKQAEIAVEAALDGVYAVRTSLPAETIGDAATLRAYKSLSMVERAFRCIKTVDLRVRPIHHWLSERVRAHVFLYMLAYHVEWHMRARLAPMLLDDDDREAIDALRVNPVAKAQCSPAATAEQTIGRTADGAPVHSFKTLLADLATIVRNTVATALAPDLHFNVLTRPTPIQPKAFDLLAVPVACSQ